MFMNLCRGAAKITREIFMLYFFVRPLAIFLNYSVNMQVNNFGCCLFSTGEQEASFTKDDMQQGKHQEYERKLHEQLQNQSRDT